MSERLDCSHNADSTQTSERTPWSRRLRNVIERMFCKLKNWRRIATRYDRYAQNYLSALALAAIMCQWI
jgi:transposase